MQRTLALTAVALCLLSPAWADVTATVGMSGGTSLDLDTGAIGATADLLRIAGGGGLAAVGNGTGMVFFGSTGTTPFDSITQANLSVLTYGVGVTFPDSLLTPGRIIAARTKTGKYSKIVITANAGGTLVLVFNTFTANPLTPTINSVQNNYGQIPAGLPNSALAPGSLIFIKGSNLSSVNDGQTLRSSAAPGLQNTIGGVSVTVTVNGISLNCPLYYLSPTQINAVLPGSTPVGKGTIFVTNNQDKSATFSISVAQSSFGIINYNGTLAATYDANNALITSFNAANPGQTIVIWGSGVGGDAANDDRLFPQKTNNMVNVPMQVLVGQRSATILYRGRSQFPGVDQIVVTLPSNVPTGCYVPLQVITGEIVSNGVTIPVAASGKTCADPDDPLTPAVLRTLSAKATLRLGFLAVGRNIDVSSGSTTVGVEGDFRTGTALYLTYQVNYLPSVGNCVTQSGRSPYPTGTTNPLDAGPAINVTGLTSSLTLNRKIFTNSTGYAAAAPLSFIPATGGDFVFFNPTAGTDVQQFSTTVSVPSNFTWTNSAALATVDRQGATFTWSGGSTAAYVSILGSATADGSSASFSCRAPTGAGQFTVPSSVLLAMPPGPGLLYIEAVSSQQSFSAPGLDWGNLWGHVTFTRSTRF